MTSQYGQGDATFQAAGAEPGIRELVTQFYANMATNHPQLFELHSDTTTAAIDKLASFLCGWMGGPRLYQEKYGPISIPGVHAHLVVDDRLRDEWLACMATALKSMDYPQALQTYLLEQLSKPAQMIRKTSRTD